VSSRGGEVVDALPAAVRTDLARLVPELVSVPPSLATDDRFPRVRRGGALGHRVRDGQPLMIVIDDLQWADASSIALYRFLAREAIGAAMVLAATVRPNEPQDVSEALADIAPRTTRWPLGGLHRSDVDSLARSLGATLDEGLLEDLVNRTNGNPFVVREIVRLTSMSATIDVPTSVRQAIEQRLAHIPNNVGDSRESVYGRRDLAQGLRRPRRMQRSCAARGRGPGLDPGRPLPHI